MRTIIGATIQVGGFTWEATPTTMIVGAIILAVYIIGAYDGMKFVFRGTRDYMSQGYAQPTVRARIAGGVAAICVFISGGVLLVAILGWIAGAGFFTRKPQGLASDEQMPKGLCRECGDPLAKESS
jgi:hypothetical protein